MAGYTRFHAWHEEYNAAMHGHVQPCKGEGIETAMHRWG